MPEPAPRSWFSGLFIPVVTPFDAVTGDVAPVAFRDNLRRWAALPIDGVVLFGSTGEGVLLSQDEKLQLVGYARDVLPPALPLIAGVAADSTRETIARIRQLADGGGLDGVLVHAPAYYGGVLGSGELRDFYRAIADASPLPIVVYHIPKYSKNVLEPGVIGELARHPNIVAVKDSSGDMKRFAEYTDVCSGECRLLVGNGALLYTALELGAAGAIIAIGLIATAQCAEIVHHFRNGEPQKAGAIQERIGKLHKEIVAKHGAPGVKAALDLLGFTGGPPRPPLRGLPERDRLHVARVMQEAGVVDGR